MIYSFERDQKTEIKMKLDTETLILALRECQQHPNISKALFQAADRLEEIADENKKLKVELQEANAYADKLVAHKDMVCLPADLANLREANARFAFDNHMLRDKLDKLECDRDSWKNAHDNQVKLKQIISDRPDMKERAKLVAELIESRNELREKVYELTTQLQENGIIGYDA